MNPSPVFYGSPSSFAGFGHLLLEPRGSRHVPCTPPLESLLPGPVRGLSGVSPVGQTVPVVAQRNVYSGSPLLRQILINGRKRQRDDGCPEGSSPSPIAVSSKRFCQEEGQVPNSLVVLTRGTQQLTHKKHDNDGPQVVPDSCTDKEHSIKTTTDDKSNNEENGFKWFEFFTGSSDGLTQAEE